MVCPLDTASQSHWLENDYILGTFLAQSYILGKLSSPLKSLLCGEGNHQIDIPPF